MMDLSDFTAQVQAAHWGWTIALFLWLVGLSGMGMFLNNWVREKALVYVCTITGIVGTLLAVSHLTRILNLPMAAISALLEMSFNFGSWMFIGICLLVVQCCLTLFYSCVFAGVIFKGECCRKLVAGDWFNWIRRRPRAPPPRWASPPRSTRASCSRRPSASRSGTRP